MQTIAAITLACAALGSRAVAQDRIDLDNGATVFVEAIPGVGWVGVESIYDVGFVDEPEGLTQAAHLAEHLACKAAMGRFAQDEAFDTLNSLGMANAETLATFTHYDATVPADKLDLVFEIEAARLAVLTIDRDIVRAEGERCHAEALNLQASLMAPMFKFALMAANQGWRFGADQADVASGLGDIDLDRLQRFCDCAMEPSRLTVFVVGDVDPAQLRDLATRTVGTVPARDDRLASRNAAPAIVSGTITWDSTARAVFVGVAPPSDAASQLILTLWAEHLSMRLQQDAELSKDVAFAIGAGRQAPVGALPMHVYATIRPGIDLDAGVGRIDAWLTRQAERAATDASPSQIRAYAEALVTPQVLTRQMIDAQTRQLTQMGRSPEQAVGLILTNAALQAGMRHHLVELYGRDAFDRVGAMTDDEIAGIIRDSLGAERFVTRIVPRP